MGDSPKARRRELADKLEEMGLDCALISDPRHIYYLSGIPSNLLAWTKMAKHPRATSFLSLDREGRAALLLGSSERAGYERKLSAGDGPEQVATYEDYELSSSILPYPDRLEGIFKRWLRPWVERRRVGYEAWHLPSTFFSALHNCGPALTKDLSPLLLAMRASKGEDEVENIRRATANLERIYGLLKEEAQEGRTELELYALASRHLFLSEGPFAYVMGDVASGERCASLGGPPTSRRLSRGDALILDLQTTHNHYWSDLSRTFVVGKPSEEQERAWEAIEEALAQAVKALRPGVKGKEVYRIVSEALVERGYGPLPHHAGHAIGLEDQEPPFLIPGEERSIPERAVMAVEVGIYGGGLQGIRIEQVLVVRAGGAELLSTFPTCLG